MLENKNIHNLVCKKFGKGVIKLIVDRINQESNVISAPSISCDNELDSVSKNAIFTSSEFTMILGTGEHDKTDWILYKSGSEVWSSKNDTVNKTVCPSFSDILETSTNYILKVRYHDSINDIWSDYGSLEFTTSKTFVKITTPSISLNQTDITNKVIVTCSDFIMEYGDGSHDKTDWILYKSDDLNTEIWSSKNDTTNKTTITGLPLEVSTTYTLKVRYHDSINDIWSDYGSLEFTTSKTFVKITTPTIYLNQTEINDDVFVTSSNFIIEGSEGSHDKTDWILYKSGSEVWSSKNDTTNKTTITGLPLEVSTTYTLKVRYHDSINDIWSDYGSLEFRTMSVFPDLIKPYIETNGIHFIGVKTASNINFFKSADTSGYKPDASNFEVVINDKVTSQSLYSLTFNGNDNVLIRSKNGTKFPWFNCESKNYIKEILEPLPLLWKTETKKVTDFSRCFRSCSRLTTIPNGLFDNNINVTNFLRCFRSCSSLTSIPENLFANNINVTNFSICFSFCSSLTTIPNGLFDNNINVTDFSNCFEYCNGLTTIPDGLFDNNINVTNFSYCFNSCSSLTTIPNGLFDNNVNVTNFSRCFEYCNGLTSIPENLFANNINVTDFSYCFNSCSSLTSIPDGLFDNNINATNFSYCFNSCSSLTTIPNGLFDNNINVTDFLNCFSFCSRLKTIPDGLFDNNINVTNFSRCFNSCSSLTSIPDGLFDNNINVINFLSCFEYCNGLTTIPNGLFANKINATDFSYCFGSCSSLTTIPNGLFDNNINVTDFSYCFEYCNGLTTIPNGLFANNINVTDFSYCFRSCSSLTSIPENLFANNINVINFSNCFDWCSRLIPIVRIGSKIVNNAWRFANVCASTGTVYVPSGSKTATTFKNDTSANVNVIEE